MGDAEGQGGLATPVFFLDENHCGNVHVQSSLIRAGVAFEKHLDHFPRGTEDTTWIPYVASRGWYVITADARIRHNFLERQALANHGLGLFYFSRNDFGGVELGEILTRALPKLLAVCEQQAPPFAASISRRGEVVLRDTFDS